MGQLYGGEEDGERDSGREGLADTGSGGGKERRRETATAVKAVEQSRRT